MLWTVTLRLKGKTTSLIGQGGGISYAVTVGTDGPALQRDTTETKRLVFMYRSLMRVNEGISGRCAGMRRKN